MFKRIQDFGAYVLLLVSLFTQREKFGVYWSAFLGEVVGMGLGSLFIILTTSVFVGALLTLQTAYQLVSPLIQTSVIGGVVSVSTFLEMAPTISALVLAGKIGSNISSQIGTMRVSEQIDALDVMGVNSASYLILPKIIGAMVAFPILTIYSAFIMHLGGMVAGDLTNTLTIAEFTLGARESFVMFNVNFMLIKAVSFGFIISSISAYQGYYVKGGAIEVGQASTRSVVVSCVTLLTADYVLSQLLL